MAQMTGLERLLSLVLHSPGRLLGVLVGGALWYFLLGSDGKFYFFLLLRKTGSKPSGHESSAVQTASRVVFRIHLGTVSNVTTQQQHQ
jgi:hypothetical protein